MTSQPSSANAIAIAAPIPELAPVTRTRKAQRCPITRTFLLTSTVSAEGKSFCANNLAVVFSNFGKKVLLIVMIAAPLLRFGWAVLR